MWLYRGPRAWLVWLNLLVACAALLPTFLECFLWLLHESHGAPFGQLAAFPQVFGAMLLGAVGENWYIASIPVVLACFLVPLLLRAPEIPSRVRTRTALVVMVALTMMLVNVGVLNWQYRHGQFDFLFA
jgi:hypothetical protein